MPDSPAPLSATTDLDTRRPFVLVTGLSGAGRGTALAALEDMGYVAVDNVPLPLLGDLMRSTAGSPGEMAAPLAFGVDTRTSWLRAALIGAPRARPAAPPRHCHPSGVPRLRQRHAAPALHGFAAASSIGRRPAGQGRHREDARQLAGTGGRRYGDRHLGAATARVPHLLIGHFAATQPGNAAVGHVVLLPLRVAARGRSGVRREVPEEPALRSEAQTADGRIPAVAAFVESDPAIDRLWNKLKATDRAPAAAFWPRERAI